MRARLRWPGGGSSRMRRKAALAAGFAPGVAVATPGGQQRRGRPGKGPAGWRWGAAVVPGALGRAARPPPLRAEAPPERIGGSRLPPPQSPAPQAGSAHRLGQARPPHRSQSPLAARARPRTDRAGGKSERPGSNRPGLSARNRSCGQRPGPWGRAAGAKGAGRSLREQVSAGWGRLCPLGFAGFPEGLGREQTAVEVRLPVLAA